MRILPEETGAVVIDMQEKLMSAMHETKACEEKAAMLLKGLQVLSVPTVIVQQYTKGDGGYHPILPEFPRPQRSRLSGRGCLQHRQTAVLEHDPVPGAFSGGFHSAAAGIKPFWINSKLWARRICLLWEQKPIFACCSHVWI